MKEILPMADKFEKADVKIEGNEKISEVNAGLKGTEIAGYAIKVASKRIRWSSRNHGWNIN